MLLRPTFLTLFLACLSLTTGAAAAQERTPIDSPGTISEPGHYVVVADLYSPNSSVLNISASPVRIDLNGHLLRNNPEAQAAVIRVTAQASEVLIAHGTLRGGGINAQDSDGSNSLCVEDVTVDGASGAGISVTNYRRVEISRCRVLDPEGQAVVISLGSTSGYIKDSEFYGFPRTGAWLIDVDQFVLKGCIFNGGHSGSGSAIAVTGQSSTYQVIVADNVVRSRTGTGIYIHRPDARVENNKVQAKNTGIAIARERAYVRNNQVSLSSRAIYCSAANCVFTGNVLQKNHYGFYLWESAGPVLRDNIANWNTTHRLQGSIDAGGNLF